MRKVIANLNMTLDGVIQAPGRPDEDTRGGFRYGGWGAPYFDPIAAQVASEGMQQGGELLFGRRTYEDFYKAWANRTDNMFSGFFDRAAKYVASRTLKEPLPWQNSTLLPGEAAQTVPALKQQPGKDLLILGSAALVRSLLRSGLIDQLDLSIHPLVLSSGRRLFDGDIPLTSFELVSSRPTSTGVIIATYRPKR
jgi:dihydrofolate reductase